MFGATNSQDGLFDQLLPIDCLLSVFSFLCPTDLFSSCGACKSWNKVGTSNKLWYSLFTQARSNCYLELNNDPEPNIPVFGPPSFDNKKLEGEWKKAYTHIYCKTKTVRSWFSTLFEPFTPAGIVFDLQELVLDPEPNHSFPTALLRGIVLLHIRIEQATTQGLWVHVTWHMINDLACRKQNSTIKYFYQIAFQPNEPQKLDVSKIISKNDSGKLSVAPPQIIPRGSYRFPFEIKIPIISTYKFVDSANRICSNKCLLQAVIQGSALADESGFRDNGFGLIGQMSRPTFQSQVVEITTPMDFLGPAPESIIASKPPFELTLEPVLPHAKTKLVIVTPTGMNHRYGSTFNVDFTLDYKFTDDPGEVFKPHYVTISIRYEMCFGMYATPAPPGEVLYGPDVSVPVFIPTPVHRKDFTIPITLLLKEQHTLENSYYTIKQKLKCPKCRWRWRVVYLVNGEIPSRAARVVIVW